MDKIIKNVWWRLAIDLCAIFGVLGFNISGIINSFKFTNKSIPLQIFFSVLTFISIIWLLNRFKELSKNFKSEIINSQAKNIQNKSEKDFIKGIPSNSTLNFWFNIIKKRAKSWDKESILTDLCFYITHGYESKYYKAQPKIQARYYSNWKSLESYFYMPSKFEQGSLEKTILRNEYPIEPFFNKFPKWKKALKEAYNMIKESVDIFELQISSQKNAISFNFSFNRGKIKDRNSFTYDGDFLFFEPDKKKKIK
jgi:hypothetical protein